MASTGPMPKATRKLRPGETGKPIQPGGLTDATQWRTNSDKKNHIGRGFDA
ncbi:hypothetical protein [Novosphingobium clariflavum]|uniref:Uncharacterized protein n=1 Tax=Novosphingobium clariflavum TaxID=2029884 RepID=A0ABV6SBI9_9SPHN|nr:hypothetical protein [Novosphingobium clariflavum]